MVRTVFKCRGCGKRVGCMSMCYNYQQRLTFDMRTVMEGAQLTQLHSKIGEVEFLAKELNGDKSPLRSRELSLAITKLQEARMWVKEAKGLWGSDQSGM